MSTGLKQRSRHAKKRLAILAHDLPGKGGVTRFVHGLLRELDRRDPASLPCEISVVGNGTLPAFERLRSIVLESSRIPCVERWSLLQLLARQRFDSVLYPRTTIPLSHLALGFEKSVVVHDLVYYERTLSEFGALETARFKLLFPISLLCSNRCFAVSKATKDDLRACFGWFTRPVSVCHAAVPDWLQRTTDSAALVELRVRRPYFFYCGSLSPRKNLLRVLEAFHGLLPEVDHRLYIGSYASWRDSGVLSYIEHHLQGRVFLLGHVRDDQLPALYSHADALVYVSLYEGFGMPILEAQTCGCPVITSSRTSCPEVAGNGALVVDAEDVAAIASALRQVLTSAGTRAELCAHGFENVQRYSWRRTVDILLGQCE